jgi:hypothetical protein
MRPASRGGAFLQHGDGEDGTEEYDAQQRETVSIAHQCCLRADAAADGNHRKVRGPGRVWRAVSHEILLQFDQPLPSCWLQHRDMGIDDERMVLFALGEEGLHRGCADCATKVSQHVEEA